ncbi:unnamed protein product [Adineta ricciae]|uniref:Uncharacterized protein n=1 Tax=Adineta ricciae TaxID=249248 RepID=A0A813ZJJ8_ADIRI|nr:unnamed protein product [Adineta ricciae]CAF0993915.1 unnamed protein product [Adineta ricciae]
MRYQSASKFEKHADNSNPTLPLQQNERVQTSALVFKDTPMYNELVQIQSLPVRLFPTELSKQPSQREYTSEMITYNESEFRQSLTPILWLDEQGDVRWNKIAEIEMLKYLSEKQFPHLDEIQSGLVSKQEILKICRAQSIFILHQHWSGFFSRVLCFIAQFGQTLYSPRIAVLSGTRFSGDRGEKDDFLGEGVKRYFLPSSICTAFEQDPELKTMKTLIESDSNKIEIAVTSKLFEYRNNKENRPLRSSEFWKMDYHHVPIRKWLFDRKKTSVTYDSPLKVLIDHSNEHIYAPNNAKNVPLGEWINTNKPDAFSSDLLVSNKNYNLTWQDHVFGSFLRYMFVLFFGSQNAPRIEYGMRVLTQHWLGYLQDKHSVPAGTNIFDRLAGLYIRRGDKSNEDSFWAKHQHWRNLSLYVKGIVDEEKQRKIKFQYIFVMTDDTSVMQALQDYANPNSKGTDESYAREHLRGRDILYNVLAPQACFDPFQRIGFEQFLVSMRFLIEHSAFTVGHTDSNVFRFFREVIYAQRQHRPGLQSYTYAQNAPDSLYDTKSKISIKTNPKS